MLKHTSCPMNSEGSVLRCFVHPLDDRNLLCHYHSEVNVMRWSVVELKSKIKHTANDHRKSFDRKHQIKSVSREMSKCIIFFPIFQGIFFVKFFFHLYLSSKRVELLLKLSNPFFSVYICVKKFSKTYKFWNQIYQIIFTSVRLLLYWYHRWRIVHWACDITLKKFLYCTTASLIFADDRWEE